MIMMTFFAVGSAFLIGWTIPELFALVAKSSVPMTINFVWAVGLALILGRILMVLQA